MEHIGCYLKEIFLQKKNGLLIFKRGEIDKYLFFKDGMLIFARSNQKTELIGEILFKLGLISEEVHSNIEKYIEPKKEIGKNLLKNGIISEAELKKGLLYQMREIALSLFPFFDGSLTFQKKEINLEEEYDLKIEVPLLIVEGIRRMKYNPALKKFLEKRIIYPQKNEYFLLLNEEELEKFLLIKGEISYEELLLLSEGNPEVLSRELYLFYCLDLIHFKEEKETKRERVEKGEEIPEEMKRRIEAVLSLSEEIKNLNYYQILNVNQSASPEEIRKAYFSLARKYHPDLFNRELSPEIKQRIEMVFDYLTKAYQTLKDEMKRQRYDSQLQPLRSPLRRDVTKEAEIKFRQGKTLYEQGRYEDALIFLEEAVRLQGSKGSYFLLLALCESKIPMFIKKAEQDFLKAIKLDPWNTEGYVGLGLLYKKEGLMIKATKQFEKALKIDPTHPVASKELDLLGKREKKRGLKDLLSVDLFGKKKKR